MLLVTTVLGVLNKRDTTTLWE